MNVCQDLVKVTFKFTPEPINSFVPLSPAMYQCPTHSSHPNTQQVKMAEKEQTSKGPEGGDGVSLQGESTATDTVVVDATIQDK